MLKLMVSSISSLMAYDQIQLVLPSHIIPNTGINYSSPCYNNMYTVAYMHIYVKLLRIHISIITCYVQNMKNCTKLIMENSLHCIAIYQSWTLHINYFNGFTQVASLSCMYRVWLPDHCNKENTFMVS